MPVEPDTRGLPWVFGPTSPWFSIGSSVDLVGLIRSTALSFSPSTLEIGLDLLVYSLHLSVHLWVVCSGGGESDIKECG